MFFSVPVGELHHSVDQQKRQQSCLSVELSAVDFALKSAIANEKYNVTLETCTCVDFSKRKLPCKHIYRLAHELNVMNQSDFAQSLSRNTAKKIIQNDLSSADRQHLQHILYQNIYRSQNSVFENRLTPVDLHEKGIIEITDDVSSLASHIPKAIIVDAIKKNGLPLKCNAKKINLLLNLRNDYPSISIELENNFKVVKLTSLWEPHKHALYRILSAEFNSVDTIIE